MTLLEKIRSKSPNEKIRIIWITVLIALIVLILIWAIIGNYNPLTGTSGSSVFTQLKNDFGNIKQVNLKK